MNMIARIYAAFFLISYCGPTAFAQDTVELRDGVANAHSQNTKGNPVSVVVRAAAPTADFPFRQGYRWGAETSRPESIVTAIEIGVGPNTVFVPLSSYADLANPRSISLQGKGPAYRLSISGGDASVAYEAVLTFTKSYVTRRRVMNSSFPDSAWEESRYSYTTR
jgi:hypothetical protein